MMSRIAERALNALGYDFRPATLSLKLDVLIAGQERRYRPDQPRAPKGTPEGGQWIDDLGGAPQERPAGERVQVAQADGLGPVDLLDHEGIDGAHAIAEHVGKSDAYLLARVSGGAWQAGPTTIYRYRAGSFSSLASANRLVNSTLALNHATVLKVAHGIKRDAYIVAQFGSPTGKEAFRLSLTSQTDISTTT